MKAILGDRLLIEPIMRVKADSANVVFVPDHYKDKPTDAIIVAKGTGDTPRGKALLSELSVGDTIRWDTRRFGVPIKTKQGVRIIISVLDVLLIYGWFPKLSPEQTEVLNEESHVRLGAATT